MQIVHVWLTAGAGNIGIEAARATKNMPLIPIGFPATKANLKSYSPYHIGYFLKLCRILWIPPWGGILR
jgi:hypothetical protein